MKINLKTLLMLLGSTVAVVMLFGLTSAKATVETSWPAGKPNQCRNSGDGFMNFESGIEAVQIESTIPGLVFTTMSGHSCLR